MVEPEPLQRSAGRRLYREGPLIALLLAAAFAAVAAVCSGLRLGLPAPRH